MTTLIEGFFRSILDGTGINAGTATVKKHADGSTLATTTTTGTGADQGNYEFDEATIGYPGQFYVTETSGTTTRIRSSKTNGQIGPVRINDLTRVIGALGDGVIDGFAVSADGSALAVSVAAGFALGAGQTYFRADSQSVTLTAADATNPRVDVIALRFYPIDTADESNVARVDLVALAGTPAATPTAPALTQNTGTYWEVKLAEVRVAANATTVAPADVTDRRTYIQLIPLGDDGQHLTLVDGKPAWDDLTSADVSDFTEAVQDQIGASITAGAGITAVYDDTAGTTTIAATGTGAATITVQEGDVTVAGATSTMDFDASDFNVTEGPTGEAKIALAYGTTAGTPVDGAVFKSHTHGTFQNFEVHDSRDAPTSGAANVTSTAGATILSDTMTLSNGVTYDLFIWGQAQLNAPSGQWIWAGIEITGTGASYTPVWLGTGTVGGERGVMPTAVIKGVVGAGQVVTVRLKAKVSGGTGSVSTASFLGQAIARGSGSVA